MTDAALQTRTGQSLNSGEGRLDLLLFDLTGGKLFGINVFRVSEALPCPHLSQLPSPSPYVVGVVYVRGMNVPVIDLAKAIGCRNRQPMDKSSIIVCESGDRSYGFLVRHVKQIVSLPWSEVSPPPKALAKTCSISFIAHTDDNQFIQVVDVEHIFDIIDPPPPSYYDECDWVSKNELSGMHVLVVEDSKIAMNHLTCFLDYTGAVYTSVENGQEALKVIKEWGSSSEGMLERLSVIISDVEMPIMDGLTLAKEVRKDHRMDNVSVCLHSTLGNLLNQRTADEIQVDAVIHKGDYPNLLNAMRLKNNRAQAAH